MAGTPKVPPPPTDAVSWVPATQQVANTQTQTGANLAASQGSTAGGPAGGGGLSANGNTGGSYINDVLGG